MMVKVLWVVIHHRGAGSKCSKSQKVKGLIFLNDFNCYAEKEWFILREENGHFSRSSPIRIVLSYEESVTHR